MERKRASLPVKIGICVGAFIFFLGLLEAGLRLAGYFYLSQRNLAQEKLSKIDPVGDPTARFGHMIREDERAKQPVEAGIDKKIYTILCVGDSYTFGGFGSFEDTYPQQLQQIVNNSRRSLDTSFRVINGGVCEYNSRQVLARLPSLVSLYHPQMLVVLVGSANRYNLALFDMSGNSVMAAIRSLRIYKMAYILYLNLGHRFPEFLSRRGLLSALSPPPYRTGRDGYEVGETRFNRAEKYLQTMSRLTGPSDAYSDLQRVWFYFNSGNTQKALDGCQEILTKEPQSVETLCAMGYMYYKTADFEKAKEVYDEAYRLNPWSQFVLSQLAYFYYRLTDTKNSYGTMEYQFYALKFDPYSNLHAYYNLMGEYKVQSAYTAADVLAFFRTLLRDNPDLMQHHLFRNYYAFFQDQKKWEERIDQWLEEDLDKIVTFCKVNNIKLIIQNYPSTITRANVLLQKVASSSGVTFVDHFAVFDALIKANGQKRYLVDRGHCTPEGHRVMAENIYKKLISEGSVPDFE
jgi:tetratricopeptide (TPR) repeat protein